MAQRLELPDHNREGPGSNPGGPPRGQQTNDDARSQAKLEGRQSPAQAFHDRNAFFIHGGEVNQEVERLWELQSVLTQISDREKQLGAKPESFAAVDREFEAANEEVGKLTASIETLAKERRRVEGELSDQQELLKKYQGQLMQVKNQQQYAAAWKEIDATRKHVKELEDSALKTIGEIEGLQAQLDERKAGHDVLKGRWDAAHKA